MIKTIFLVLLTISLPSAASDNNYDIENNIRELFDLPEVISSRTYEFKRNKSFRTSSYIYFYGKRVRIPRGVKPGRAIGKCIKIGENTYSDNSIKYYYRGRCK